MTDMILQPRRMEYNSSMLHIDGPLEYYSATEFTLVVNGINLHAAKWIKNPKSKVCVVYLHTNGRALVDAIELLPACNILDANLFSFDMPGCGKSDGCISLTNVKELSHIIDEIASKDNQLEIILWARGFSTFIAIEYASQRNVHECVKFLVLDSPFTSVGDIVMHVATSTPVIGDVVPTVFVKFALKVVRNSVKAVLGIDPYVIRPAEIVHLVRTPCFVLSADEDQFIPESMGEKLVSKMRCKNWLRSFPGEYDSPRDECLSLAPVDKILRHLSQSLLPLPPAGGGTAETKGDTRQESTPPLVSRGGEEPSLFPLLGCDVDTAANCPTYRVSPSGTGRIQAPPAWKEDTNVLKCGICNADFNSLIRWKHHCRNCGDCVCDSCSRARQILPQVDCHTAVRVCDVCMVMTNSYEPETAVYYEDKHEDEQNKEQQAEGKMFVDDQYCNPSKGNGPIDRDRGP